MFFRQRVNSAREQGSALLAVLAGIAVISMILFVNSRNTSAGFKAHQLYRQMEMRTAVEDYVTKRFHCALSLQAAREDAQSQNPNPYGVPLVRGGTVMCEDMNSQTECKDNKLYCKWRGGECERLTFTNVGTLRTRGFFRDSGDLEIVVKEPPPSDRVRFRFIKDSCALGGGS